MGFADSMTNSATATARTRIRVNAIPSGMKTIDLNISILLMCDHSRPSCSASGDAMSSEVRIGYFGAWSAERSCDQMQPENIPAGVLTHINVAFEYISANHEITDEVGHITGRVSRLKNIYPGLRVNIAIGQSQNGLFLVVAISNHDY
jgi:GH18 family chitinase